MTVLTFGFLRHHARDSCAIVHPSSSAIGSSFLTFSMFSAVITFALSHSYPFRVARDPGGVPFAYFPLSSPDESGLHIVVPNPISLYRGRYSFSTRSLCSRLYCGCSIWGGVRPFCIAIPCARIISPAAHSEVPQ